MHEVGMAFFVAMVLNLTIEHLNRKRHDETLHEIQTSVLTATLKRRLPDAIFRELDETVLRADGYREKNMTWYTLTDFSKDCGSAEPIVRLEARARHNVVNATDHEVIFPVGIEISLHPEHPSECGIDEIIIDGTPTPLEGKIVRGDVHLSFMHSHRLPPGKSCTVEIAYRQVQHVHSFEAMCNVMATTDLGVEVLVPNRDFKIHCIALHPKDPVRSDQHDEDRRFAWHLPGAALPGQGMLLIWAKKSSEDASSTEAAITEPALT
jgi:hypothetical protein